MSHFLKVKNSELSRRQGCRLSSLLFLVVISDVIHVVLTEYTRGVHWTMTSYSKYLHDYADVCPPLHRIMDLHQIVHSLKAEACLLGLNIKTANTKALRISSSDAHHW